MLLKGIFFKRSAAIVFLVIVILSCNTTDSDYNELFEDGILIEVRELLGEEFLDVIENELDIPIHRGSNPPNILAEISAATGGDVTVVLNPTILVKSNVPNENQEPGLEFADTYIRLSHQDMKNFTIKFDRTHLGVKPYIGENSFIIGDSNKFTAFGPDSLKHGGGTVLSVNIFSGVVEEDGISAAFGGIVMIENQEISGFIPNGTGRIFRDKDGFSELTQWPTPNPSKASTDHISRLTVLYGLMVDDGYVSDIVPDGPAGHLKTENTAEMNDWPATAKQISKK